MEVYHKITPVRSIQQSINLIKALKNEEEEQRLRLKPKSCVFISAAISDDYGSIPNLRAPDAKVANRLKYFKPDSPVPTRSYRQRKSSKSEKKGYYSMNTHPDEGDQ
jgi:hypothetical protein